MTDPTNDIDALLDLLAAQSRFGFHSAVTALVAERDEYKARCKAQHEVMADMVGKQREAASDLREQFDSIVPWMDQVTAMLCHSMTHSHDAKQELVTRCDAAIDAMRKGEAHGK